MNKGLITLLFKARDTKALSNWRSITLLSVVYKIYAKVLQLRLQVVLMEVVDMDHATFLPQWYFLDNVLLVHETMDWTKCTNQSMLLLKLDFAKVTKWIGNFYSLFWKGWELIANSSIWFKCCLTSISLNRSITKPFKIERRVKQNYPMAPYLFILVGKVFNFMVKEIMRLRDVRGVLLAVTWR